ncbi:MAG TPA: acyltransferase [Candidatus Sulfotelmatobacter sp.]
MGTLTLPAPVAATPVSKTAFYRPELDVVRFFAFLSVFVYHTAYYPLDYFVQRHVPLRLARVVVGVGRAGAYGVDLFFVLSAYLITELLLREKEEQGSLHVKSFYMRRMLRIWPLYYFFIAVAALAPFLNPTGAFNWRYVIPFLLLAGNWATIAFGPPHSAALPLWSVSVEEQFYLLWPPIVARLSRRNIVLAAIWMIVAANVARVLILSRHGDGWDVWVNTIARLDPMAAGILIAVLLRGQAPRIKMAPRLAILISAITCVGVVGYFAAPWGYSLPWLGTLVSYPLVGTASAAIVLVSIGIPLRIAFLEYLGKISYGLYVYHTACIWLTDRFLHVRNGLAHMCLREIAALALTTGVSAVSYALLEKPFLRLKRKYTLIPSRPV